MDDNKPDESSEFVEDWPAYKAMAAFDFGVALQALKNGHKVAREGWNGIGMFIFLTEGRDVENNRERSFAFFLGDKITLQGHIDMRDANGKYVTGWLASQADMLADDWVLMD